MAHIQDDRTLLASAKALRAEILACADQIEAGPPGAHTPRGRAEVAKI
jgi:hypothetical protein